MNEGINDCGKASNTSYTNGCRCDACRNAHYLAQKVSELRKANGNTYFVDAAPARERLLRLYAVGYSIRELERLGIPRSAQQSLAHFRPQSGRPITKVKRETAEKLEAISGRRLASNQCVPADAARLMLSTWGKTLSGARMSRELGISRTTIGEIMSGRRRLVRASTMMRMLENKGYLDSLCSPEPKVPKSGCPDLSDWEIDEVMTLHGRGMTLKDLAIRYKTSPKALSRALRRREKECPSSTSATAQASRTA